MRKILFTLTAIIFWITAGATAQQKFPAWMDEVEFSNNNSANKTQGFSMPQAPIDPATGQQSSLAQPKNSAFGKPKLPDFNKMRDKAIKAQLGKSYDASLQNVEQLKEKKSKLETLLAANTGENERIDLLKGIGELDQKITLSNEFIRLLGQSTGHSGIASAVASLTDAQFDRIRELQQLLFPHSSQPIKSTLPVQLPVSQQPAIVVEDDGKEPSEDELRQRRTYRPGRIKSFFIESKKAQQQNEEKNPE